MLTYTTALRLSYGLTSRLVRLASTPLKYGPYTIPARTPISQNHYCVHHDEILFPDSRSFMPERWLNNPKAPVLHTPASVAESKGGGSGKLLSRYLVAFMKGSRTCVGMHLAHAQLHIVLANVFRRCELELYETEWRDVGFVRDMFVPMPASDGRGLRVLVKDVM
jgi:cytochrome P450